MQHALVTGGCGFIGSYVVQLLVNEGWRVTVLDNLRSGCARISAPSERLSYEVGDVRSTELVRGLCQDVDAVFHLAAIPSVVDSFRDPVETLDVGVRGLASILQAMPDDCDVPLIFSSSSSVYGNCDSASIDEHQALRPLSPYALSKQAGEQLMEILSEETGRRVVALRYFNVYGAGQDPTSPYGAVVPKFIDAAMRNAVPTIYGDGGQVRDFVHVSDVARANLLARDWNGTFGIFNIGSGKATTISSLWDQVADLAGSDESPRHEQARAGDIRHSVGNVDKAARELGFLTEIDIRDGLRAMLANEDPRTLLT